MPLSMRKKVFITAAITGSGSTQDKSDLVPRSPQQIADAAIEAAKAGQRSRIAMSETRKQEARPRACRNSTAR